MVFSNSHLALELGSWVYEELGIEGSVMIHLVPLDADGYCYDNAYIEINENLSQAEQSVAICHELIHWKQYQDTGVFEETEAYNGEIALYKQYRNEVRIAQLEIENGWSLEEKAEKARQVLGIDNTKIH